MTSHSPPSGKFDSAPPGSLAQPTAVQALARSESGFSEQLGKYRVLGALGQGGMANVYLAVADGPEGFRKLCVLKLLKDELLDDADFRTMFLDEARLAARLSHPNIVQTFEVDDTDGHLLLAMEFVDGQPLTRVVRHADPEIFTLPCAVRILVDVLEALDYAHSLTDYDGSSLALVHRDVTPHNVLVGYDGRVKLVDFGIAKSAAAAQLTQAGVVKGKVGYMAAEQATGAEIDGRADVFSVGVMLWELMAGKRLTAGLTGREVLMRRIRGDEPKIATVVPDCDQGLAAICDRAMAVEPDDRYEHAADMQVALENWLKTQEEPSRKTWGGSLREAFATERRQLRSLIEQRLKDAGVSVNLRKTLSPMGTGSIQALTPEMASIVAKLASEPPPSHTGTGSASIPAKSQSIAPPASRQWGGLFVGATILAASTAALVYVTQMPPAPVPAAPAAAPRASVAAPLPVQSASPVLQPIPPLAASEEEPEVAPAPHVGGGGRHRPAVAPGPVKPAASAADAPVAAPKPPAPKASTRALDEQDPYK